MRQARKNKGISQAALAQAIGVSQNTVSRWENDGADDIHTTTLRALLRELATSEAFLRGENDDTRAPDATETAGVPEKKDHDRMNKIHRSLAKAFDAELHTLQDLDDVRAILRESQWFPDDLDTDRAAVLWLNASARLRNAGQPVTAATLAVAIVSIASDRDDTKPPMRAAG